MRDQIAEEVQAVRSGVKPAWTRIAQLMDIVESSRYWEREGATSFSAWLRTLAQSLDRKERMLWRYLTAGKYYQQVRAQLQQHNVDAPPLTELPPKVSPDHIELLAKLARVAPPEVVLSLAERVVTKQITRAQLELVWQAFRPALGGRTARGRGTSKPRIDREDPQQRDDLLKAVALNALHSSDRIWKDVVHAFRHVFLLEICGEPVPHHRSGCPFDAVAVVHPDEHGPFLFHGFVYIGVGHNAVTKRRLLHAAAHCDYFWAVRHMEARKQDVEWIPDNIGLLLVDSRSVQVIRPAKCISHQARYRGALLSGVFRYAVENWHR